MLTETMPEMMPRHRTTPGQNRTDQQSIERTISPRKSLLWCRVLWFGILWGKGTERRGLRGEKGEDVKVGLSWSTVCRPGWKDRRHRKTLSE